MRIAFLLLLLLCVGIAPVWACTATPTPSETPINTPLPPPTIADYIESAPIIFVGIVLREVERPSWGRRYEIQVETYLKGSGYNLVEMEGYGYGSDCLPMIWERTRHIFFAHERRDSDGTLIYYRIIDYPVESLETIEAITGQANPPEALPLDVQLSRLLESDDLNWFYIGMSIFAALVGLLAVGFSLRLRNRRKSKAKRDVID